MTTGANKARGEFQLTLGGKTYRLRPSHEAIVAIEEETRPLLVLVRLANAGDLGNKQMGIIAAELIRAGADEKDTLTRAVHSEPIGRLIYEEGVGRVLPILTLCLLEAATGGRLASGEAKAAPAETTEPAGAA